MSTHEQYSDIPRGQVIGSYDTYLEAQRAVDFLSDQQFPVQHVGDRGLGPEDGRERARPAHPWPRRRGRGRPAAPGSACSSASCFRSSPTTTPTRSGSVLAAAPLRRGVRRDLRLRRAPPQSVASATSPRAARSWRAAYEVRCTWAAGRKGPRDPRPGLPPRAAESGHVRVRASPGPSSRGSSMMGNRFLYRTVMVCRRGAFGTARPLRTIGSRRSSRYSATTGRPDCLHLTGGPCSTASPEAGLPAVAAPSHRRRHWRRPATAADFVTSSVKDDSCAAAMCVTAHSRSRPRGPSCAGSSATGAKGARHRCNRLGATGAKATRVRGPEGRQGTDAPMWRELVDRRPQRPR